MRLILAAAFVAFGLVASEQVPSERFYQAIRNDDLVTLRALVREFGANPKDAQGHTPLMWAGAFGSVEAMQILFAGGAEARAAANAGATALHWSTGDIRKVRLLIEHGAEVNAASQLGRTPLLVAASTSGTAETVGLLLDKGADLHAVDGVGVTALIAAASVDDATVATRLLARGADVNAKAAIGQAATALMGAAYNGNVELTRRLLAQKADVAAVSADRAGNVRNGPVLFGRVTALHMATASGNPVVVKLLLDAGAAVDPLDVRGMTPLMWSVSTDRAEPRVARLLLDKGADASLRSSLGESPLEWAQKFNNPSMLAALRLKAVETAPSSLADGRLRTPREAVERTLPLLRRSSARMLTDGGCVACHAQPMTAIAARAAAQRGWRVERAEAETTLTIATLTAEAQGHLQARERGGLPDTQLYNAFMMAAQSAPPTVGTDALVHYLAAKQRAEGNWHGVGATRAPIQDGDFSRTAMSIRALTVYGMPARRFEFARRIERAARWLESHSPVTTEDRVMRLLGLIWANAGVDARNAGSRELLAAQRADGGWAQTPYLGSDAYATGQVLYALHELGIATDPPLQRGTTFLLRTQNEDGSWHVKSRAMKIQPYFESAFPHGHDQWISQMATSWAVMALSVTPS